MAKSPHEKMLEELDGTCISLVTAVDASKYKAALEEIRRLRSPPGQEELAHLRAENEWFKEKCDALSTSLQRAAGERDDLRQKLDRIEAALDG